MSASTASSVPTTHSGSRSYVSIVSASKSDLESDSTNVASDVDSSCAASEPVAISTDTDVKAREKRRGEQMAIHKFACMFCS